MKNVLYHVTSPENAETILNTGLIPKGAFVSLSEDPKSWYQEGMAILEVNIENIGLAMHTFHPDLDEITVWGCISPERIRLISNSEVNDD